MGSAMLHALGSGRFRRVLLPLLIAVLSLAIPASANAQNTALQDLVSAVVRIKTFINPDGSSVSNLGREREGSGIVIDESGLVLTISYLIVEANAVEIVTTGGRTLAAAVVGYDHETGFGLLRTLEPPNIKPLPLGKSADLKEQDPVLVSSFGGTGMVLPVRVVSRRVFTGSWEYLVEDAIFTSPPHSAWSGSALISREGRLVGIGSLIVGDAKNENEPSPGNMFVPIDLLPPVMGDLLSKGRIAGPGRPWLGVNAQPVAGKLVVGRVTPESPAAKAGLKRGDVIVGIGGVKTATLTEFYQKMWSTGAAGVTVPLDIESGDGSRRIGVPSVNRLDMFKRQSTF
jgi:S1-C subfamily serine protease